MTTEKLEERLTMISSARERSEERFEETRKNYEIVREFLHSDVVVNFMNVLDSQVGLAIDSEEERLPRWSCHGDDAWDSEISKDYKRICRLYVSIFTDDNEQSERVRGMVQRVFNTPALREVSTHNGDISYVFRRIFGHEGVLKVSINKGALAPGCRIVEKTEVRTDYVVECDE
tara:strand:+ start:2762 stop:3283 length:522 start_codon:yes stop_codon:yes gene_type:complete